MKKVSFLPLSALLLITSLAAGAAPAVSRAMPLMQVRTFMYQLQGLENPSAVEALAKSDYDLLVVEPTATVRDQANFDMKAMVAKLHAGKPGRIVLAYLDAGQAESFRCLLETGLEGTDQDRTRKARFHAHSRSGWLVGRLCRGLLGQALARNLCQRQRFPGPRRHGRWVRRPLPRLGRCLLRRSRR